MLYHKTVQVFAGQMIAALAAAGPRPGKVENEERNGWIDDHPDELQALLIRYQTRLSRALDDEDPDKAYRQCLNVANAAMMLAEVLGKAGAEPPINPLDAIKGNDMAAEQSV